MVKVRSNQEEIEYNMDTGGEIIKSDVEIERDRTGYNVETKKIWYGKTSPQRGYKGIRKRNAQVVCGNSPWIRNVTT